jgi:hypothetical protein
MRIQAKIIHPDGVGGVSSEDRLITTRAALEAALEDLCAYNAAYLTLQPRLPDIYATSIFYKSEPPGEENWLTYPVLLAIGFGDCEDLACARVAKLRQQGERKAKPYLYNKGSLWHVMLKRQDGTVEDPSAALGMNAV